MPKLESTIICGLIGGVALPALFYLCVTILENLLQNVSGMFIGALLFYGGALAAITGLIGGAFVGYWRGKS
jgi:hypothetical protein